MTNRLDEIRNRCAKATGGPWKAGNHGWLESHQEKIAHILATVNSKDDLKFCASSREDIPYLLEQIAIRDKALMMAVQRIGRTRYETEMTYPEYWLAKAKEIQNDSI